MRCCPYTNTQVSKENLSNDKLLTLTCVLACRKFINLIIATANRHDHMKKSWIWYHQFVPSYAVDNIVFKEPWLRQSLSFRHKTLSSFTVVCISDCVLKGCN